MSGKVNNDYVKNPFKEKVLGDLNTREETAHKKVQEKQQQYSIAMKNLNIFQEKKYYAQAKLKSYGQQGNNVAQAQYKEIAAQAFGCEVNADVVRGSLLNSLHSYSNAYQTAYVANSILQ